MSDQIPVLAIIDRECVFLADKLARYRRDADRAAKRKGERCVPADDLCERTEQRLADLRNAGIEVSDREHLLSHYEARLAQARTENDALRAALADVIGWVPGPSCFATSAPSLAVERAQKLLSQNGEPA